MSVEDAIKHDADFETWAHENQLPPTSEGWRMWLMMAGRGFGKTRAGAEWIHRLASGKPGVQVALVGATIADARSIMVEGVSGLLSIAPAAPAAAALGAEPGPAEIAERQRGALFSGDDADGLRGPEHDFAWCDELAKWRAGGRGVDESAVRPAARAAAAGAGDDDAAADGAAAADRARMRRRSPRGAGRATM